MRAKLLLLTALMLAPLAGCTWMKDNLASSTTKHPKSTDTIPSVAPEQLVSYLNEHASRLQSISYDEVRLQAFENRLPRPQLKGHLAASEPRDFRMSCEGGIAGKLDVGSNVDQFWIYLKAVGEPTFVVCSHADFDSGRAKMPGGIPFEPNWVMQALGMTQYPLNIQYDLKTDTKDRTYILSWASSTPSGLAVRKEVVFDVDAASNGRPQVKKHIMRDAKTNKVLVVAEIKKAATVPPEVAPRASQKPVVLQYPTSLSLRWEEQKFEMDLTLEQARVNQPWSEDQRRRLFTRPEVGVNPIDLAGYRGTPYSSN